MSRLEPILEPILNSIDFESLEFKTTFNHKNRFEPMSTKSIKSVGSAQPESNRAFNDHGQIIV